MQTSSSQLMRQAACAPVGAASAASASLRRMASSASSGIVPPRPRAAGLVVLNATRQQLRRHTASSCGRVRASRRAVQVVRASADFEALKGLKVISAATGFETELLSLWAPSPGKTVVIPFLSHFGDLTSWEYAQRLQQKVLPLLAEQGVQVITVGLGSPENARAFATALNFPVDALYADPRGACYSALNFSPGFAPDANISPYLKLLPMLAGIGSPGTLQEVIRGYVGDTSAGPVFDGPSAFDVLGNSYQRPFELATLRLFNMVGILPKWGELSPPDARLLVQQGGTLVFRGTDVLFRHTDQGILKYTDVAALLAALEAAVPAAP